jgi:CubicO group peptidase (beta-lactamase class C family)
MSESSSRQHSHSGDNHILFESKLLTDNPFLRGDAHQLGFKRSTLVELLYEAKRTQSDALIIIKDNYVIAERYFNQHSGLIELMSITKSIVSLAVGFLITEGKILSVDTPLGVWYPEWREGLKSKVTLRHILTHTSGLECIQVSTIEDHLKVARESRIVEEPGTHFAYNNYAVQLLAGVISSASGVPLDIYIKEKLFEPLKISNWLWKKDRAGNALAFSGLSLNAHDLARIGLLMLNEGKWDRKMLLTSEWIRQSTSPGQEITPFYGFLWWLRPRTQSYIQTQERLQTLQKNGFPEAVKLRTLLDRQFAQLAAYWNEAKAILNAGEYASLLKYYNNGISPVVIRLNHPDGFYADGWLGQRLVIYRAWNLVTVRLHCATAGGGEEEHQRTNFPSFLEKVEATVIAINHP